MFFDKGYKGIIVNSWWVGWLCSEKNGGLTTEEADASKKTTMKEEELTTAKTEKNLELTIHT